MGTLKMFAGAFALYFFLGSGVFAADQTSLSDILIKLQAMQKTINENRNKLQSIPSKLQDLTETVQENQNKLKLIPSILEGLKETAKDNQNNLQSIPSKLEDLKETVQENQNNLQAIPNKLDVLKETVQENQNNLQAIPSKLEDLKKTVQEDQNNLKLIPSKLEDLKKTVQENQNKLQAIPSKFEYLTESLQDNHNKLETIEGTVQDNQNRLLAIPNKLQTLQETVQDNKKLLHVLEMLIPIPIETCKINMDRPLFRKYYRIHGEKLALCDTETDGGGWVVIQRRIKGDVLFHRTWEEYKQGFGSVEGDFWIGNEKISSLTMMGYNELRFDMKYKGESYYMIYSNVKVGNEADLYRIKFTYKTGNTTDNFIDHNGMAFSTFDKDNDGYAGNCAKDYKSGWWFFDGCLQVNMNGVFASNVIGEGINWKSITEYNDSLEYVEMKLRRL
ncbi:fibrinogen-like protein A [Physella acuta]|uniref:fibrinogen-like protein A n=1 Tax=Physella acuta TaxID=109671 RepID=UPI0027DC20B9|nr:fibrinogen-like protein A [Physella acuta]